jgi:hypothetical protein
LGALGISPPVSNYTVVICPRSIGYELSQVSGR